MARATVQFNPISLSDRIKSAESNDELLAMASEGCGYKYASDKTRRRWEKRILVRRAELLKIHEYIREGLLGGKPDPDGKTKKRGKNDH